MAVSLALSPSAPAAHPRRSSHQDSPSTTFPCDDDDDDRRQAAPPIPVANNIPNTERPATTDRRIVNNIATKIMERTEAGAASSAKKNCHHYTATSTSKDNKVIDHMALAEILRESAQFVERGEFDPILYQALTDFRVYYKQKYPKTKGSSSGGNSSSKSKKDKPSRKKSAERARLAANPDHGTVVSHDTFVSESNSHAETVATAATTTTMSTVPTATGTTMPGNETNFLMTMEEKTTPTEATIGSEAPFDEQPESQPQSVEPKLTQEQQDEEIRRLVEAQIADERARLLQEQEEEIQRQVEEQLQLRLEEQQQQQQLQQQQQERYEELMSGTTTTTASSTTLLAEEQDGTSPTEVQEPETATTAAAEQPLLHEPTMMEYSEELRFLDKEDAVPNAADAANTIPSDHHPAVETAVPVTPAHHDHPAVPPAYTYNPDPAAAAAASTPAPPPPPVTTPSSSASVSTSTTSTSTRSTTTTASKFHLGTALFGGKIPFKTPKSNPFKHGAFAATSKKNAQRAREDMEAFRNDLSRQAESSGRRKVATIAEATAAANIPNPILANDQNSGVAASPRESMPSSSAKPSTQDPTVVATTSTAASSGHPLYEEQQPPPPPPVQSSSSSYHYRHDNEVEGEDTRARSYDGGKGGGESGSQPTPSSLEDYSFARPAAAETSFASTTEPVTSATTMDDSGVVGGGGGGIGKPSFQQPVNKGSALIANGWIEQYRRSKMRFVWKEVLASLVEARRPGEETTLWIQRETIDPTSGRKELEALHQIPVKAIEDIKLNEMSTDNQFTLKMYNSVDEFVFRCVDSPVDSIRWVQILQNYQKLAKGMAIARGETGGSGSHKSTTSASSSTSPFEEEKKGPDAPQPAAAETSRSYTVRELRAVCHGAGINTAGMERGELEAAAEEVRRRGTYFPPSGAAGHAAHPQQYSQAAPSYPQPQSHVPQHEPQSYHHHQRTESSGSGNNSQQSQPQQSQAQPQQPRMGIKELRAICHGAGINTVGMERGELEAAAEEVRKRGTYFDPPAGMHAPQSAEEVRRHQDELRARQDEYRRQEELKVRQNELRREQLLKKQHQEEEARRRAAAAAAAAADEERRRLAEEEVRRRRAEEEARRRAAAEEEARRRLAEEEHRRRVAAEEQRRRQQQAQEAQERYRQQQAAWQKQQEEEEIRRRKAEQEAAEQRRRHEEAVRKQQQWAGSTARPQQQQRQYYAQQQQQQHPRQPPPQQHAQQRPHPQQYQQQQQQDPHAQSAASAKYAKMANASDDGGQAVITRIKHDILIHWALQPPQLQMLRPIDVLVTTIHKVFPPALGVAGHDYFTKWKAYTPADLKGTNGLPDEEKLKKSVRKIRFFLHPDKLPRDLNEEQQFMVKMLWDVTSDAWEEFQKHTEDLDWIHR